MMLLLANILLFATPATAYKACSICGEHHAVGNLEGTVPYGNGSHPCGLTEDLGLKGELEECEGGQGKLVKVDFGTFRSDDDGFYWFACKCVRVDTNDHPCHVCGDNRIVSRPLDTINKLPGHPPSDQYQYLNKYSCQNLQDGDGFDDNCFDHRGSNWGTMEYSPEMAAIFEENCGCEARKVCNLCPPGHKLGAPTLSIGLPRNMGNVDDGKFYDDEDANMFKSLACRVVELRAKNMLIPEGQCQIYRQLIQEEQECGGCVPMTPNETDPSARMETDPTADPSLHEGMTVTESLEMETSFRFKTAHAVWLVALVAIALMGMALRGYVQRLRNACGGLQKGTPRKETELLVFGRNYCS